MVDSYLDIESVDGRLHYLLNTQDYKDLFLGDILDNCRWGSESGVMLYTSINDLLSLVKGYIEVNSNNLPNFFNEDSSYFKGSELPYIRGDSCSLNKLHNNSTLTRGGLRICSSNFLDSACGNVVNEENSILSLDQIISRLTGNWDSKNVDLELRQELFFLGRDGYSIANQIELWYNQFESNSDLVYVSNSSYPWRFSKKDFHLTFSKKK